MPGPGLTPLRKTPWPKTSRMEVMPRPEAWYNARYWRLDCANSPATGNWTLDGDFTLDNIYPVQDGTLAAGGTEYGHRNFHASLDPKATLRMWNGNINFIHTVSVFGGIENTADTVHDYGTTTAAAANTFTDSSKSWTVDEHADRLIRKREQLANGTWQEEWRIVQSNTATQITLTENWSLIPSAGAWYLIVTAGNFSFHIGHPRWVTNATHYGNIELRAYGGTMSELRFYDTESTNRYLGFKTPALAATTTWTWPDADGSSGYVLQTNGSAALSWLNVDATYLRLDCSNSPLTGTLGTQQLEPSANVTYSIGTTALRYNTIHLSSTAGEINFDTNRYIKWDGTNLTLRGGVFKFQVSDRVIFEITYTAVKVGFGVPLRFYKGGKYLGFKPPTISGSSMDWTLPDGDGTVSQVMKTDGAGNLGWDDNASEKFWSFSSPRGSTGTFYYGGFYLHATSGVVIGFAQAFGTANLSYAAHAYLVLGSQTVDELTIRVSGTSMLDDGTRAAGDTEDLVFPSATGANNYKETVKKWLGTVLLTVVSGTDQPMNWGFVKYWDNNNTDFIVKGIEATWLGGANDAAPNILLRHHKATGWTFGIGAATPPAAIVDMNTDHNTEIQVGADEHGAWKRDNLSTAIEGSVAEGTIVEIVTSANRTFENGTFILRIVPG